MVLQRLAKLARGEAGAKGEEAAQKDKPTSVDQQRVSVAAVTWALRLLIGREPVNEAEVALHRNNATIGDLRRAFMQTHEFQALLAQATGRKPTLSVPAFMLRQPADARIPWRFEPPSLATAGSQLCTAGQFEEPAFAELMDSLRLGTSRHRKLWEHAYVLGLLLREGLVGPGRKAIGFGCGKERIPAFLAARGTQVLATDAPAGETFNQGWATTNQYATESADLFFPGVIEREDFDRRVSFRPVDMNAIPEDLAGQYDACWSACSLEHLGSLKHGLDFIENSLGVLRPGGLAVHTTEFNLSSNDATIESPGLSIYRRRDIEALCSRLIDKGHQVLPLNLHPGDREIDEVIDTPPFGTPHLKLMVGRFNVTSIGIAVRKARA
jgi:hypothetical protein